ncbi:IS21 family transposase, partial [Nitratireductor aquimarinus]|nr:IS21 family transposase [Nitratireductor aquimarinus]
MSQREASKHFGISRDTVRKMMTYSVPPGYRRRAPVRRPKLEAFIPIIDGWLEADRTVPRKQRHTA